MRRALSAFERWFWRAFVGLLLIAAFVVLFLVLGAGVGGSGDP